MRSSNLRASIADVMFARDPFGAGPAHPFELFDRRVEHLGHGGGQFLDVARRHQPAGLAGADQFGDARDVGRDDRPPERERLHDHDRQPFGKAGQDQPARVE